MIKVMNSIMAFLIGMAIGAVIASAFAAIPLVSAGYLCAAGLVAAEYWQYRFLQDEIDEYYNMLYLKADWEDTKA